MGVGLIYQSFIAGRYLNQEEESGVGSRHRMGVSTGRPLKRSHSVLALPVTLVCPQQRTGPSLSQ